MNWRSDKIEAAFEASDEYWMEATTNGDMAMMEGLIVKHGYDRERPLSSKLKGDDWAEAVRQDCWRTIRTVERMRPWLAALALASRSATKDEGYDFTHGVERSLEASARAARKTVKTFETVEQQMQIFSLPEELEVALLVQSLTRSPCPDDLDRTDHAWMAGDLATLEAKTVELKTSAPELYDVAFVHANPGSGATRSLRSCKALAPASSQWAPAIWSATKASRRSLPNAASR